MTPVSTALPGPEVRTRDAAPAAPRRTRPFYWSVRRELWENRSIHLAPVGVGIFVVVALMIHGVTMPSHMPGMLAADPTTPGSASFLYRMEAGLMLVTAFLTGAFYSLEALNGERRDRSILFWKSLPVSDLETVLAKASIPLLVLPLLTFAALVAMHIAMLVLSTLVLLVEGQTAAALWREVQPFRIWGTLLYALAAMALWHAPIHAFLLLMSGWARRAAALWVVLPLVAIGLVEKVTMNTTHVAAAVQYRLVGWYGEAFVVHRPETIPFAPATSLSPLRFLGAPGLWVGLVVAAAFLAAAVRLRRLREPI
jgi:ABC-2 type transport system permease protein